MILNGLDEMDGRYCQVVCDWLQGGAADAYLRSHFCSVVVSDGVDAPTQRHLCARMVVLEPLQEKASMEKVSIIGLDCNRCFVPTLPALA